MKLSKRVPARTRTEKFRWCKQAWMTMTPRYREIRGKCRRPMDTCFWCKHKFKDGDIMALAARESASNVVLCPSCACELKSSEKANP